MDNESLANRFIRLAADELGDAAICFQMGKCRGAVMHLIVAAEAYGHADAHARQTGYLLDSETWKEKDRQVKHGIDTLWERIREHIQCTGYVDSRVPPVQRRPDRPPLKCD